MSPFERRPTDEELAARGRRDGEPDVVLDVPRLSVDEIALQVDGLHARIALDARLGDLIRLHVGADAEISNVALELKGVEAEAHLRAHLDNVLGIFRRALETVDANPELLHGLAQAAGERAAAVANGAGGVLAQGGDATRELAGDREATFGAGEGARGGGRPAADGMHGAGGRQGGGER